MQAVVLESLQPLMTSGCLPKQEVFSQAPAHFLDVIIETDEDPNTLLICCVALMKRTGLDMLVWHSANFKNFMAPVVCWSGLKSGEYLNQARPSGR